MISLLGAIEKVYEILEFETFKTFHEAKVLIEKNLAPGNYEYTLKQLQGFIMS